MLPAHTGFLIPGNRQKEFSYLKNNKIGWLLAFSVFILAKRFNNWSGARLPWAFSRSTEHGWKTEVRLPYKLCCGGPRAWGSGRDFPKQYVHCPARTWLTELYHCDLSVCAGDRRLTWWNWVFPLAQIIICMSPALFGRKNIYYS